MQVSSGGQFIFAETQLRGASSIYGSVINDLEAGMHTQ